MTGLHAGQPVLTQGAELADARVAVVLVHGRGGSAEDIMGLAGELDAPDVAWIAPQAANGTWYPLSFLAPLERNEPWLSSALAVLGEIVGRIEGAGVPARRIVLLGFSQGGCLALEFAARNPRRYGALAGLSAGVIGPPGTTRREQGDLEGTPVFLGCSDRDPHVPEERVRETAELFRRLHGEVTERIYPGLGHTVNRDELQQVERMLRAVTPRG